MTVNLFSRLDHLAKECRAASGILILLDFDGTLVPIQSHPSEAHLVPEVATCLSKLSLLEKVRVGLVSGRELDNLRRNAGLSTLHYAGNHGLEIEGPGLKYHEPIAQRLIPELIVLADSLACELKSISNAWVENKRLSASVHFRQVRATDIPRLEHIVRSTLEQVTHAENFLLRYGKFVLEIRPRVDWNKGQAALWLERQLYGQQFPPLRIFCGDDETDEDVFRVWHDAITVHVGQSPTTAARYSLQEPAEVHRFLMWLENQLNGTD